MWGSREEEQIKKSRQKSGSVSRAVVNPLNPKQSLLLHFRTLSDVQAGVLQSPSLFPGIHPHNSMYFQWHCRGGLGLRCWWYLRPFCVWCSMAAVYAGLCSGQCWAHAGGIVCGFWGESVSWTLWMTAKPCEWLGSTQELADGGQLVAQPSAQSLFISIYLY